MDSFTIGRHPIGRLARTVDVNGLTTAEKGELQMTSAARTRNLLGLTRHVAAQNVRRIAALSARCILVRISACAIVLALLTARTLTGQAGQWNQLVITDYVPNWTDSNGTLWSDVLNLDPSTFVDQQFAQQHIACIDNDCTKEWLIMGYSVVPGANFPAIGDSLSIVTRNPANGEFNLNLAQNPVLHFNKAVPPADWTTVGGLGAGSSIASTAPLAAAGGYKYFAIVPVGDFNGGANQGHPGQDQYGCVLPGTTTPAMGWITIAVSKTGSVDSGSDWGFIPQSGQALTTDPTQSIQLIKRVNSQGTPLFTRLIQSSNVNCVSPRTQSWSDYYWHIAFMYNKFDQKFYIAAGYAGEQGIGATWWRLAFNPSATFGLGALELYDRTQNGFVPSTGVLTSDLFQSNAGDPPSPVPNYLTGPVDPHDLRMLYRSDGSFDSVLFIYTPGPDFNGNPTPYKEHAYYVIGSLPTSSTGNFVWGNPQELNIWLPTEDNDGDGVGDTSPPEYWMCGAGGAYFSLIQHGVNGSGAPQLSGYVATFNQALHPQGSCTFFQSQGALPVDYAVERSQPAVAAALAVDSHSINNVTNGNLNGVFEPGETVQVETSWKNDGVAQAIASGVVSIPAPFGSPGVYSFAGPTPATYTTVDAAANYGTIAPGSTISCLAAGNCYVLQVSATRPGGLVHWDAAFTEQISQTGLLKTWLLHIGNSFTDVLQSDSRYKAVETVLHYGITAGCNTGTTYCPDSSIQRQQMAVMLLKEEHGSLYAPPSCQGIFGDVTCPSQFANWIEELYNEGVTAGCQVSPPLFCPTASTARQQMAVFLLKIKHGVSYTPPTCSGIFSDVTCPSTFANWIEELAHEGGVAIGSCPGAGTTSGKYCPGDPVTRGQMAVYMTNTFALNLYRP